MKQIDLKTWEEFEAEVERLNSFLSGQKRHGANDVAKPLFRGQSLACWQLKTSLERYLDRDVSATQYNQYLLKIKSAVEAYTGRSWTVDRDIEVNDASMYSVPNYEFMLYARHHGFPSPLLDWSQSPYIALFFAFQNADPAKRVSIFVYVDDLGNEIGGIVGEPQIRVMESYVSSHRRHFMQQSKYTIATENVKDKWMYCSHEKYFSGATDDDQDMLIKFTLPGELKNKYLQKLQLMNINAFTLYGTDESLMDMLAFKEIIE